MSEWLPIDTAPTDGTIVLVADVFGVTAAAFDGPLPREEYEDIVGEKVSDDEWCEEIAKYSNTWVSRDPVSGDIEHLWPSHWMKFPSAPTEASGRQSVGMSA